MKSSTQQFLLFFAWLIALTAMLSTLLMSELLRWPVCHLCWYQRIALYPLVILLGISAYRNEKIIIPYALPFPVIGLIFSVYQYLEQMMPGFTPIELCSKDIPCSVIHLKLAGFITIPLLSAIACAVLLALLVIVHRARACRQFTFRDEQPNINSP